jgi:ribonuclease III
MNQESITAIEKRLGYTFRDKNVLIRSLTRKAFAQEQKQQKRSCEDQEVYRVLGDAILKAVLVEMLIEDGCDSREEITTRKIELEKRESLGAKLREMQVEQFIRFGRGEQKQNISVQSSVLGETFEALIAAIYIDSGSYETTNKIVVSLFKNPTPNDSIEALDKPSSKCLQAKTASGFHILYDSCNVCFQPDICDTMRMCYFDITGDD